MSKKVLVLGHFGYSSRKLNGQTMRTRSIYELLEINKLKHNFHLVKLDTSSFNEIGKRLLLCINFLFKYFIYDSFVILPAQRAVVIVLPLFFFSSAVLRKKVHFIAIGGWISEFLSKNPRYIKYAKSYESIYVQTNSLKQSLEKLGLDNVICLPNFRFYDESDYIKQQNIKKISKVVIYSRVIKEKGIEIAIEAIEEINRTNNRNIELSIYGPIDVAYKERFESIVQNKKNIYYKGIIDPNKVRQTLSEYDILLFPTYYIGEGFPGTILDSMSSGVPVIASDWKYNSEIVADNITGLIFETNNKIDLINKISYAINNPDLINEMKINCLKESSKYNPKDVGDILIQRIVAT